MLPLQRRRLIGWVLGILATLSNASSLAGTMYKCREDSSEVPIYTNQKIGKNCTPLFSFQSSLPKDNSSKQRSAAMPSPGDFPRVSGSEQKARDSDRRAILDKELADELQNLDKARKALLDAGNQPPEKLQALRETVALHERNVESLKKELGNLR